jgi:hypothetical protein
MLQRDRSLIAAIALLCGGCYEYLPARDPATLIGQRVQLTLTDSGMVALASQVGPSTDLIEGTLLRESPGQYVLAMAVSRTRFGNEIDWRGEQVTVPRILAASIAERRFSRSRSVFAGGLAAVGIAGATVALRGAGSSGGSGGVGGKPTPQ